MPLLPAKLQGVPQGELERERRALRRTRARTRRNGLLARQHVVRGFNAALRRECAWGGAAVHSGTQTVILLDFAAALARPGSDPPCIDSKFDADGMHVNANVLPLLQGELDTMGV